jgi:hypothetical protein
VELVAEKQASASILLLSLIMLSWNDPADRPELPERPCPAYLPDQPELLGDASGGYHPESREVSSAAAWITFRSSYTASRSSPMHTSPLRRHGFTRSPLHTPLWLPPERDGDVDTQGRRDGKRLTGHAGSMLASRFMRKRSDDRAVVDGDHPLASWILSFDPRAE